jgi:hypothetical protein
MEIIEQYFGLRERIIKLSQQEIVEACLAAINKQYPARDMESCNRTNGFFYDINGEEITDDLSQFIFVESFKIER